MRGGETGQKGNWILSEDSYSDLKYARLQSFSSCKLCKFSTMRVSRKKPEVFLFCFVLFLLRTSWIPPGSIVPESSNTQRAKVFKHSPCHRLQILIVPQSSTLNVPQTSNTHRANVFKHSSCHRLPILNVPQTLNTHRTTDFKHSSCKSLQTLTVP